MPLQNYRVEFLFPQTSGNAFRYMDFDKHRESLCDIYHEYVLGIKEIAKNHGIKYIWHFYEPCIEITWLSENNCEEMIQDIKKYLNNLGIYDCVFKYPFNGEFADWFCTSEREMEFGAKRHSLCSEFVDLYHEYKDSVDGGKGKRKQVERTIHTLCNPLGIDYITEAKLCFSRGLICALFCIFSFDNAVWIYRNIFRQTY